MNRWYHTWWGVVLISLAVCLCIGIAFFVGLTVRYWWQIRHGQTPAVALEAPPRFTVSGASASRTIARNELETIDSPWLGKYGAPVTIVEFIDFKCPNCRVEAPILRQVDARYHNNVRIIARHFPAESLHPGATELAYLSYCVYKLNPASFWGIYDTLYASQDTLPNPLDDASIGTLASVAGVDSSKLKTCMQAPATVAAVTKDYLAGVSAGVRGTPTFFVNGTKIEGALPFEAWQKFFEQH